MFINVEKLQKWKENAGTQDETLHEEWVPVALGLNNIENYYPEKKDFTEVVYFILETSNSNYYRWKFDIEELIEVSPIVKNSFYTLMRNLKLIEIVNHKFYKYNLQDVKISWFVRHFWKNRKNEIDISNIKAKMLKKIDNDINYYHNTIRNNLPQIWMSCVEFQKKALQKNMIFANEVEEIKLKATLSAWKSARLINKNLGDIKLKRAARKKFASFLKKEGITNFYTEK